MTGHTRDYAPNIKPAGKVWKADDESAAQSLQREPDRNNITPPKQRKFKHSSDETLGKTVVHWGKADDPAIPDIVHGRKNQSNGTAAEVMHPETLSPLLEEIVERREAIYESHKREPLGKSLSRNYNMPATTSSAEFKFGVKNVYSESAKNLIFPEDNPEDESPAAREMYRRTHGDYAPGEQKNRSYNWSKYNIEPTEFRFGIKNKYDPDGVKKTLNPLADENSSARQTRLIAAVVEDFNQTAKDELGKTKNLGFGERGIRSDVVFGKPNRPDEWGAMDCIRGGYSLEEQMPDPDLGRSTKVGLRNIAPENKVFGVPTIRTDIKKPKTKSIADIQNYGDEVDARGTIYPFKFAANGVFEDEFLTPMPKEELRSIINNAGFGLSDEQFEQAYQMVLDHQPEEESKEGQVSLHNLRVAINRLSMMEVEGSLKGTTSSYPNLMGSKFL